MQAVILVGGEGTRLRPLTSRQPKPVITLVDRPFLVYMLEWLRGHGVDDVILQLRLRAHEGARRRSATARRSGSRLRYVVEPEPRGTAGALKYAEEQVPRRSLPDAQRRRADRRRRQRAAAPARGDRRGRDARPRAGRRPVGLRAGPAATTTTRSRASWRSRRRRARRHRPLLISAGHLRAGALGAGPDPADRNVSIEREVWPRAGRPRACTAAPADDAYWMDIGTPERYLQGTFDILEGNVRTGVASGWTRLPRGRRRRRAEGRSCRRRSSSAAARSRRRARRQPRRARARRDDRRGRARASAPSSWTA